MTVLSKPHYKIYSLKLLRLRSLLLHNIYQLFSCVNSIRFWYIGYWIAGITSEGWLLKYGHQEQGRVYGIPEGWS